MSAAPRWLNDQELHAWQGFRLMSRSLDAHLARELACTSGLSMQDYDVLSALTDTPHHRWCAKQVGAHLQWTPSRLSHHVDRMQRRGLVRREPCDKGRGTDIVLTPAGLLAIQGAAPEHVEAVRASVIDHLSAQQLAALSEISDTVMSKLDREAT